MTREQRLEKAALKVLDTWPGTPEELGADLQVATTPVVEYTIEKQREALSLKRDARKRIEACNGGAELLKLEEDLYLNPTEKKEE